MPKKKPSVPSDAKRKPINSYTHEGKKRANNPPVGLVTPETDPNEGKKTYAYDPHLDPQLPWAGRKEHPSFHVPTVSLHFHERVDPLTIIEAVKRKNGAQDQISLFASLYSNLNLFAASGTLSSTHNLIA
jgi:adenine-specific DNA-methyltransferase